MRSREKLATGDAMAGRILSDMSIAPASKNSAGSPVANFVRRAARFGSVVMLVAVGYAIGVEQINDAESAVNRVLLNTAPPRVRLSVPVTFKDARSPAATTVAVAPRQTVSLD